MKKALFACIFAFFPQIPPPIGYYFVLVAPLLFQIPSHRLMAPIPPKI